MSDPTAVMKQRLDGKRGDGMSETALILRSANAREIVAIAEYAREYVAATCAFEGDQFGPGWQERLGRKHMAWAHLKGSCGFTDVEIGERA